MLAMLAIVNFLKYNPDSQNKECIIMVKNFKTNKENLDLLFNKYIERHISEHLEIPKVILDLCILFLGFGHNKLDDMRDTFDFKSAMKKYKHSQAYAFEPNALRIYGDGTIIEWNPFDMFPVTLKLSTLKLFRNSTIYRKLFKIKILSYDTSLCKPVNISIGLSGRKYKIETLSDAYSSIATVGDIISVLYMDKRLYFGINDKMHKTLKVTEFTPLEIMISDKISLQLL